MTIGQQIKREREARSLSHERLASAATAARVQDDLGRTVTVSAPALLRIERGKYMPSHQTLRALAAAFECEFVINNQGTTLKGGRADGGS